MRQLARAGNWKIPAKRGDPPAREWHFAKTGPLSATTRIQRLRENGTVIT
jgi:hypothetical protein